MPRPSPRADPGPHRDEQLAGTVLIGQEVLAGVHKDLRDGSSARSLRLVPDGTRRLTRILQLAGLTNVFDLSSSLADALAPSGVFDAPRGES